jgi:hypothetical protein
MKSFFSYREIGSTIASAGLDGVIPKKYGGVATSLNNLVDGVGFVIGDVKNIDGDIGNGGNGVSIREVAGHILMNCLQIALFRVFEFL